MPYPPAKKGAMRYRLRTLLIVLAILPPVLAGAFAVASALRPRSRAPLIPKGGPGLINLYKPPPELRAEVEAAKKQAIDAR